MDYRPPWLGAAILTGVVSTPVGVEDAAEVPGRAHLRTAVDEHGAGFVDVADDQVQTAEAVGWHFEPRDSGSASRI
jgi:hypothetical protein